MTTNQLKKPDPIISSSRFRLKLLSDFFDDLHKEDVLYCHWKSNQHLDASMTGNTDLDLLFHEGQRNVVEALMKKHAIKKFEAIRQKKYEGIEDYIGLDAETGKIVHLHTHHKLVIGENYLKSYHLNIEEQALLTRVYDADFDIYRTAPALELILLTFRSALKIRNRDRLKLLLGKNNFYPVNALKEYEWLMQRCSKTEVAGHLRTIFSDNEKMADVVTGPFIRTAHIPLAPLIRQQFGKTRIYKPVTANLLRWYRELYIKFRRKQNALQAGTIPVQRVNPRGGLVIAVVGADGSGKSTVISNLNLTFRKKLDVNQIYFGMGAGSMSWYRKLFMKLKRSRTKHPAKGAIKNGGYQNSTKENSPSAKQPFNKLFMKAIEALMVTSEKAANYKRMQSARKKGMLVICDRYPQDQLQGYNDGPALGFLLNVRQPLLRWMARFEKKQYQQFNQNPPDIIFKLIAGAHVVEARKPGQTAIATLQKKIDGIKQLQFGKSCEVITVNAEEPLQKVLSIIKGKIWNAIA